MNGERYPKQTNFHIYLFFSLNPYTVLKSWLSSKVPLLYTHGSVAFAKMIIGKKETTANSPSTWAKVELNKGTVGISIRITRDIFCIYERCVCVGMGSRFCGKS